MWCPDTLHVIGNVTGNITGNMTGNITGSVTGNVTGNVIMTSAHDVLVTSDANIILHTNYFPLQTEAHDYLGTYYNYNYFNITKY